MTLTRPARRLLIPILATLSFASAAQEMPTYRLHIKEGRFTPETLEIPANTRFRLEVKNDGPGASEFESLELKKELVLAPGVARTLVFFPMKPGTYKFFDDFHPETGQGRFIVK